MNEHEIAILGAAMLDPTTIDIAAGIVSPGDFADHSLGRVFAMMQDMHAAGEPVGDHQLLITRLRASKLLDPIGGVAGVASIAIGCPNASHVSQYAKQVKEAATRRRLRALSAELATRADDLMQAPNDILDWLDGSLTRHRSGVHAGSQTLAAAMQDAIDDILATKSKERVSGLPTGLMQLDSAIGGLYPGEMIVVAARPSIGKSALGSQVALHNAEQGRSVLLVSLEMTGKDIATRQLAASLGYEVRTLRAGLVDDCDISNMQDRRDEAGSVPLHIWSGRGATMAKIRAAARIQQATTGLALLVVDYLGLITAADRRKPRWEAITEISGELKSLALELSVPVLCLCQLNREAEKSKPNLGHLRDAGAIEQDADVVMLLHREARDSSAATIDIAKARNGATGCIEVAFDCAATRFIDVADAYSQFSN
ncbi:MAG TPA: hypothetical protein DDZ51_05825 [Planctomycetaceae bacterium]|nr:hypothetical protein [Planctomycetaceae bacterium]